MIIDLSHSSHKTALDAIQASDAPVIFSHSSAFALCNSTRNVHDDVLKLLVSLRMYLIRNREILKILKTFWSHLGKSLKVHFNLFLRILAYESEEKLI